MSAASYPSLLGRVAIITGASRGIGRALALALARAGAKLMLTASSSPEELSATERDVAAVSGAGAVVSMLADVCDPQACDRVSALAFARFGALDALVNNAAIGMRLISEDVDANPVPFWEMPVDKWRRIFETNAEGPYFMARAAVPYMLRRGFGRIVNVSTRQMTMSARGYQPYGPSKAALEMFTRAWAKELDGLGITCNAILPGGPTDTDIIPKGFRRSYDGPYLPTTIMNEALLWLLSDASNGINGRRIIATLWDASLPPDEAGRKAMPPSPELPTIL